MTAIDDTHAAMTAAPDDDDARMAFFERVAEAELHLLLAADPEGTDTLSPEIFETSEGAFVLAFDTEARLARFTGGITPRATLSGRAIAGLLAGQGVGLGLNLDVAPSSILLPSGALEWLHDTLGVRPSEVRARPVEVSAPSVPEKLAIGLDRKLAAAAGLARRAILASVRYDDDRRGTLLAIIGAVPGAEPALARVVGEALIFSGVDAGELDVAFLEGDDSLIDSFATAGLTFDLPEPDRMVPVAPGSDPDAPPRLR